MVDAARGRRTPPRTDRQPVGSAVYQQQKERLKEAQRRTEAEKAAREAKRGVPFRSYVPKGGQATYIILDEELVHSDWEHNYALDGQRNRSEYALCIAETDVCPACHKFGNNAKAYFNQKLTVIDLTPYRNKNTDEEVPFTRKIWTIKQGQLEKLHRGIDDFMAKHGSLRGAVVTVYRTDSDTSPASGDDFRFDMEAPEDVDSKEAREYYSRVWTDRENKVQSECLCDPVNYDEVFPYPAVEELEAILGIAPPPGSDRANGVQSGSARRGASERAPDPAPQQARRGATQQASQPARRGATQQAAPAGARRGATQQASQPARRGAAVSDTNDDAPWDDEKPNLGRPGVRRPATAPATAAKPRSAVRRTR